MAQDETTRQARSASDDEFVRRFDNPPPWRTWLAMGVVVFWLVLVVLAGTYEPGA